jgi:hypothetical protein
VSEEQKQSDNRARPTTDEFRAFVAEDWAPRAPGATELSEAARHAAPRREAVSEAFPGDRLIIPAGGLKVRSNDTDYVFRPHSAFVHLTGLGGDREPDAVLVLEPRDDGTHEAILYFRPLAGRDTDEFFSDARYGEFWVGARPTIEEIETELGLTARHIDEFADAAVKDAGEVTVRLVRDADRDLTRQLDDARTDEQAQVEDLEESDDELAHFLSQLRLVKDEWEVEQLRRAVAATHLGFEAVIAVFSASSPATRPTASATTRSRQPATTPRPCTGSATPVTWWTATCSCSTRGSRWTRCSPPTSRGRCPRTAPSATRSARSTMPCMPRRRPAWRRSSRATAFPTSTLQPSG